MDTGSFEKLVNRIIDKKYKIESVVGVGGMAYVLKATDITDGKLVAIKFLSEEFKNDERAVKRFINESKTIAMLNHENIVKVHDVVINPEKKYIVMEFIDGITLKDYIDKIGVLGWKEAIHYIKQVLSALDHAHEKLVIHRDIKPQNIMLLPDGTVKVTDFGIAKQPGAESITMTDKAIGTVNYISPEQASGAAVDTRTDIYSVGVMLYEMVTGKLPFVADSPVAVAMMQVSNEPLSPREINPQVPIGLEQIILKAMQKKADERFSGAAAMLKALNYFAKNPDIVFAGSVTDTGATGAKLKKSDYVDEKKKEANLKKKRRGSRSMFPIVSGIACAAIIVLIAATSGLWFPVITSIFGSGEANTIDKALDAGSNTLNSILAGSANEEVEIPSFVDRVYNDDLIAEMEEMGYTIEEVLDDPEGRGKAPNTVTKQDPEAGSVSKIKKGTLKPVKLYINKSNDDMYMPNCVRMNENEAKSLILSEINGISTTEYPSSAIITRYYSHPSYPKGYVISTSPAPNTVINNSQLGLTEFVINVSMGKEIENTVVPVIEDKTEEELRRELQLAGIAIRKIINEPHPTVEKGKIINVYLVGTNTVLTGGEEVAKGIASVDIRVSIGDGSGEVPEEETGEGEETAEDENGYGNSFVNPGIPGAPPPPASEVGIYFPVPAPSPEQNVETPAVTPSPENTDTPDAENSNTDGGDVNNQDSGNTGNNTAFPPPPPAPGSGGTEFLAPPPPSAGNTTDNTATPDNSVPGLAEPSVPSQNNDLSGLLGMYYQ